MNKPDIPSVDQLRDLPLATPPYGYWPQTWGWLALLLVLLALLGAWGLRRYLRWRRDRYRREGLALLDGLAQAWTDPQQRLQAMRELPALLKRVALSMPAGGSAARLGGQDWQAFLQRHSPVALPADFAVRLGLLAYAPEERLRAMEEGEGRVLLDTCRQWIEDHHVAV